MKKMIIAFALCATALASPAIAEPVTYTTNRIAAVTVYEGAPAEAEKNGEIRGESLLNVSGADCTKQDDAGKGKACFLVFQTNTAWFTGRQLCVTGRGMGVWAVKRDGTIDPTKRTSCAPIGSDGSARVSGDFPDANATDTYITAVNSPRFAAWASQEDVRRQ